MLLKDDLTANQTFGFLRVNFDLYQRVLIEVGTSVNFYHYQYSSYFPTVTTQKQKTFANQLMPKVALSYLLNSSLSVRGTVSKGYSPPTLAEVRASDQLININLQPEYGWNYELGARLKTHSNRFYANVNAFSYRLKDAIVRRVNSNDTEYFVNAGGTKQQGVEIEGTGWLIPYRLLIRSSYTYSKFSFKDFANAANDYSGNKLTGVPDHFLVSSAEVRFAKNAFLFAQHSYTSSIPLNDANTVDAKSFHLTELKTGLRNLKVAKTKGELFLGANNLFNATYSLGNDLNAANGRYFNAAAKINYYFGIGIEF
ncbi:MAG: TonB-dependent receptor [Chitinophagaceae bacterium]|nr:MAG: TonB-dependent receptor [Chitinophagaceae bacterium]